MMWFWHAARGWIALFALFAASQFLPTLGYDTGYLDPYVYVLAIVASMALARNKLLIVAIVGFAGPFVHESFVFLWLPLIVLALWRGELRLAQTLALSTPILGALIVYFGHSQAAAILQINAAPLSDQIKIASIDTTFGFTLTTLAQSMWYTQIYPHAVNYIIALTFYTLPAALIAVCYASNRKDRIALLLATYAPALNSLTAWDLKVPRSYVTIGCNRSTVHAVRAASRLIKTLSLVLANYSTTVYLATDLGVLQCRLPSRARAAGFQRHSMGSRHSNQSDSLV